jgi:DNA-binding NarL/FixJ family response regulator
MSPSVLSDVDARALVRSQLPEASAPFCAACAAASGADPELLHALCAEIAARGWIGSDREIAAISGVLPGPVTAIVVARLARLPESARELVTAVAVLGPGVSMESATATAGLTPDAAQRALDPLVFGEFLRPLLPLDFVAPIVRIAVREALTPRQRVGMRSVLSSAPDVPADRLATLTPSELRVVELAARGMTTKEIASSLFVTSKTIEFHLSNIYRKLELPSSRAELSRALEARLAPTAAT